MGKFLIFSKSQNQFKIEFLWPGLTAAHVRVAYDHRRWLYRGLRPIQVLHSNFPIWQLQQTHSFHRHQRWDSPSFTRFPQPIPGTKIRQSTEGNAGCWGALLAADRWPTALRAWLRVDLELVGRLSNLSGRDIGWRSDREEVGRDLGVVEWRSSAEEGAGGWGWALGAGWLVFAWVRLEKTVPSNERICGEYIDVHNSRRRWC